MYDKIILKQNLDQINNALKNKNITVIGVTKNIPLIAIIDSIELGVLNIGESYTKEALIKYEELKHLNITWHFIGTLQTNKIKYLADKFSFIHSVYKTKHLDEIAKKYTQPVNLFFEVNMGNEFSKGGTQSEAELFKLIEHYLILKKNHTHIKFLGLMSIPPYFDDPNSSKPYFDKLKNLLNKINTKYNLDLKDLSIGMSSDYKIAIGCGATYIRIGTLLYGSR